MSIYKMVAAHPEIGSDLNEALVIATRHAMFCTTLCTSCADACMAEPMDMRQCIRACLDCADICEATMKIIVRRTGRNSDVMRAMIETCIKTCETCAAECSSHDHEHCRLCADMCRECAADCRKALPTIQ